MNKRIIYPNDAGGVSIIIPSPSARERRLVQAAVVEQYEDDDGNPQMRVAQDAVYEYETDEEFAQRIAAKDVPAGKPFKIVDATDIPEDRTFRNAWEYQA